MRVPGRVVRRDERERERKSPGRAEPRRPLSLSQGHARASVLTRHAPHLQVVRLSPSGGARRLGAAPAAAVREREREREWESDGRGRRETVDGGPPMWRARAPWLCRLFSSSPLTRPPSLPNLAPSRDYPVTADEYELLEECGRGVSATVRGEEERRERARRRLHTPLVNLARPLPCSHSPHLFFAGLARHVQAVRRDRRRQADGPGERQLQPGEGRERKERG